MENKLEAKTVVSVDYTLPKAVIEIFIEDGKPILSTGIPEGIEVIVWDCGGLEDDKIKLKHVVKNMESIETSITREVKEEDATFKNEGKKSNGRSRNK